MSGWLEGMVVACTGGGSGIGRAALEAFLGEGASVGVLELDQLKVESLSGLGDRLWALQGDAVSAKDNAALVEGTLERFGRLDAAVTFVGVFDHYEPLCEISEEAFDEAFEEIFQLNVKSVMATVRASRAALAQQQGSIVVTCSSSSFYAGRGGALYVASKFALRGLVLQLAHELAPEIRVNGVAPGGTISTDLRGARSLGQHLRRLDDRPGRPEALRARTPLGVALEPKDHAGAYVYLASARSRGLTGEIIRSDGGLGAR